MIFDLLDLGAISHQQRYDAPLSFRGGGPNRSTIIKPGRRCKRASYRNRTEKCMESGTESGTSRGRDTCTTPK